jgi:hypothetical protein|tara:strand:- start:1515 stop:1916 length:402 start_codon:yes stop_codon:yes gene_type:complete
LVFSENYSVNIDSASSAIVKSQALIFSGLNGKGIYEIGRFEGPSFGESVFTYEGNWGAISYLGDKEQNENTGQNGKNITSNKGKPKGEDFKLEFRKIDGYWIHTNPYMTLSLIEYQFEVVESGKEVREEGIAK